MKSPPFYPVLSSFYRVLPSFYQDTRLSYLATSRHFLFFFFQIIFLKNTSLVTPPSRCEEPGRRVLAASSASASSASSASASSASSASASSSSSSSSSQHGVRNTAPWNVGNAQLVDALATTPTPTPAPPPNCCSSLVPYVLSIYSFFGGVASFQPIF